MKRTRSVLVAAVAALALVAVVPSPAGAADGDGGSSTLTATVTAGSIGSRSVTSVPAIAMTSSLNSSTLSGGYSVVVTEAARTGTTPWSVTGVLAANLSDGTNSIARTALAISDRAASKVNSGGTTAAGSTGSTLDSAVSLMTNTGQDPTAVYTGVHTGTGTITLTPPNGTKAGVYTGTFTVTLVQ